MDVVILAGGKGTRMTDKYPKPLVRAKGKAILDWQLDYLLKNNVDNIVLALGHRTKEIIRHINSKYKTAKISFSKGTIAHGTGGALKRALKYCTTDFILLMNCDDLANININKLRKIKHNSICVAHPRSHFGLVKEVRGYAKFEEKPILKDWVSCGWVILDRKEMLKKIPDEGSMEYDVYPKIKLKIFKHAGFWKPLNSRKDVDDFEKLTVPKELYKK
ncbi:NTP transferase domain-containing protein [Candidatus Woesearchaeota archaeon]|jgi:NDP-sugar pyrophosphorylase family protein|nr:NTP transferase domain-containing protein [Candidatus Woesearchaeota archaeon]